jgi:hypothetical protein
MPDNYPDSRPKPANDAYTGMLAVSFVALLIGCAALYFDYSRYPAAVPPKVDYTFKDRSAPEQIERAPRADKQADDNPPPGDDKEGAKDLPGKKDQ